MHGFPTCTIQVSYGPPHVHMVHPQVKCFHALYDSYGPHTLYGIGIIWFPSHVPITLYGTAIIWFSPMYISSSTCTYGPPTCTIWCQWLINPHSLYGIGIWRSHLTLYGTAIVWSPHMWSVFMSYMNLIVLPYLRWNRYCMVPHMYVWSPLTYMEQLSYGPPHVFPPHVQYDVNDFWSPIPYME